MNPTHTRRFATVAFGAMLIAFAAAVRADAQQEAQPYDAIVTADVLDVRSGAGDTYYPFMRLEKGEVITVIGERFGWARIKAEGHAFKEQFAYVKARELRLSEDGKSGLTLGRVQVIAPNLLRDNDPGSSWKWVTRLEPEKTVRVLGKVQGNDEEFHVIAMPKGSEGWVSINFIRGATEAEVTAWNAKHAAAAPQPHQPNAQPEPAQPEQAQPLQIIDQNEEGSAITQAPPADSGAEETQTQTDEPGVEAKTQANERPVPAQREEKTLTEVTLEDLEGAYRALKKVPVRGAEIQPLLDRYAAYREEHELTGGQQVIADARIALLETRLVLQKQMLELDALGNRTEVHAENTQQALIAIDNAASYNAVGVVTASTIYDGKRLPQMLRLVDPHTARTIVYVQPNDEFDFTRKIGQLVGVVGKTEYDGGMRLSIITPKRVDILTVGQ